MDRIKMSIEQILSAIARLAVEFKDALMALAAGIFGGILGYLGDVKSGDKKWEWAAFVISVCSAGFLSLIVFIACVDGLNFTPGLSIAAAGMLGHLGADKVKVKMTEFFLNRLK